MSGKNVNIMTKKEHMAFVGTQIRNARESLDLTREELSEKSEIEPSFLAAIENGKKSMTLFYLRKICTALNVSSDYILGLKSNEKNDTSVLLHWLEQLDPEDFTFTEHFLGSLIKYLNQKNNHRS